MRIALAAALFGTTMVGCSASTTSTSGDAGLADAVGGDTPGGSGVVRSFTTYVLAVCPVGTATSACPAQAQITVFGEKLTRIEDAVVKVNGELMMNVGSGNYGSALTAPYATSYEIVVTRGGDELRTTLPAPRDFTFTVTAPTAANQPGKITWTPSGDATLAEVQVGHGGGTPKVLQGADTGEMIIDAANFPEAGSYQLSLTRSIANTASGSSASIVSMAHTAPVLTVP